MDLRERHNEQLAIDEVLSEGGLLVVEGVAGIGKTALLQSAAGRAVALGRRTLVARGALLERGYGYGLARQLLDPVLRDGGDDRLLKGTAAGAADVFAAAGGDEASSYQALLGLTALTVNAAEHAPLALVIDDAQWADGPSLRFAGFLARRLDGPDVAMVVAIRTGDPGAPEDLLDDLRSAPGARRVTPRALSDVATAGIIHAARPECSADVVTRCHAATGGNPLLIAEVVRGLDDGEDPLEAAARGIAPGVRRRVARADASAPAVARAVAILGPDATLARVAALAEVAVVDAGRAATALAAVDVLTPGSPYGFVHPLITEAVLAGMDDGEHIRWRHRAVQALQSEEVPIERVAAHLLAVRGAGDAAVVDVLRAAAADASARGAAGSAVLLLTRALEEPPPREDRGHVLRELATAERLVGDEACIAHARAALGLTVAPEARAELRRELARCEFDLSRYTDAAHTLSAALREAPDDLAAHVRDALRVDLMTAAMLSSAVDAGELLLDLARGVAPEDPGVMVAAEIATTAMRLVGDEPVAAYAGDMARLLMAAPPSPKRLDAHTTMWWAMSMVEEFDVLEEQLDTVERSGPGWMRRQFSVNLARGLLEHRLGRLDGAIAVHEANLELGGDNHTGALFTLGGLAVALSHRGDVARATAIVDAMRPPSARDEGHLVHVHWCRGRVLADVGRDVEAIAAFDIGWEIQRSLDARVGPVWEGGGAERIACLERLGRVDEAYGAARDALQAARTRQLRGLEGIALRTLGLLGSDGTLLAEAAALLDLTPLRLERARAHLAHGEHLRRAGQRTSALEALRRAADLAHACGARPLAERAREELVLAGARPRRAAVTGRDALTAAEARVARSVAAGRTNREVAGELFVTIKTVEGHLARVFRKLGITRRQELAEALTRVPG